MLALPHRVDGPKEADSPPTAGEGGAPEFTFVVDAPNAYLAHLAGLARFIVLQRRRQSTFDREFSGLCNNFHFKAFLNRLQRVVMLLVKQYNFGPPYWGARNSAGSGAHSNTSLIKGFPVSDT